MGLRRDRPELVGIEHRALSRTILQLDFAPSRDSRGDWLVARSRYSSVQNRPFYSAFRLEVEASRSVIKALRLCMVTMVWLIEFIDNFECITLILNGSSRLHRSWRCVASWSPHILG